jgi:hypothetical protein
MNNHTSAINYVMGRLTVAEPRPLPRHKRCPGLLYLALRTPTLIKVSWPHPKGQDSGHDALMNDCPQHCGQKPSEDPRHACRSRATRRIDCARCNAFPFPRGFSNSQKLSRRSFEIEEYSKGRLKDGEIVEVGRLKTWTCPSRQAATRQALDVSRRPQAQKGNLPASGNK